MADDIKTDDVTAQAGDGGEQKTELELIMDRLSNLEKEKEDREKFWQQKFDKVNGEKYQALKQIDDERKKHMSEEERRQHELEEKEKEIALKEKEVHKNQMNFVAMKKLTESKLDSNFIDYVIADSEEAIEHKITQINNFIENEINKRLEQKVKEKFGDASRDPIVGDKVDSSPDLYNMSMTEVNEWAKNNPEKAKTIDWQKVAKGKK